MVGFSKVKNYYNLDYLPSTCLNFHVMDIVNSIPNEWRIIIKQSQQHICLPSKDTFQINIESTKVNVLKVTSKMFYNEFNRKIGKPGAFAQKKIKLSMQNFLWNGKKSTLFRLPSHIIQKLGNFSTNC